MISPTYDPQQRKLLSIACHASPLLNFIVLPVFVPIVIVATTNDPIVKANAKESINFFISVFIWYIIAAVLCLILIGFLLLPLIGIMSVVLPIIAIIAVLKNPDQPYRYPFIFRLF
ncbi:MAG: DUF4870 domain-containing protein [Geminocystis sp.]|nr:DUF4870 domain-containing protein [Geminocystis sp.]HIK36824.1 DUF4870 domain-containing protein [Geminocystis sp. M7585_C2015_104]